MGRLVDGEWRPAMETDAVCGCRRTEHWTNEAGDEVVIDCLVQLDEEGQNALPEYGVCAWYYYGGLADPDSQSADPNELLTDPNEPAADPNESAGANAGGVSW